MKKGLARARLLVTLPALFLAIVPPLVDLNETHLLNPAWTGHARLHTAWLLSSNSMISLLSLWILWRGAWAGTREAILLATALVGSILAGFFVAAASHPLYGGAFADAGGVPPILGGLDANIVIFSALSLLLPGALFLARKPTR
ncbi:MAG: hypothetical protein OSB70_07585 [Myxococcota bacterium]|nr:hypothetical protein [Myxococcota bacterium]